MNLNAFSSVLEIAVGVNLAVSYVYLFVDPIVRHLDRRVGRLEWWLPDPSAHEEPSPVEDAINSARRAFDRLRADVEAFGWHASLICLGVAVTCFVLLLFAEEVQVHRANIWRLGLVGLALVPVGSALYVWARTRQLRREARERIIAAERLVLEV